MSFWVKEKSFYQKMAAIAIPLALQNLINVGVSLLDTVMLGQLGEVAMSGSSLGNQTGLSSDDPRWKEGSVRFRPSKIIKSVRT